MISISACLDLCFKFNWHTCQLIAIDLNEMHFKHLGKKYTKNNIYTNNMNRTLQHTNTQSWYLKSY